LPDLPTLAFSTLACPEWSAEDVVARAATIGYDAIEWRGGPDGHVSTGWSSRDRVALRHLMAEHGTSALAVTSYTDFVTGDARARTDAVEQLRRHLELAADLGASTVRTFVGIVDDDAPLPDLIERAVDGIASCVESARASGVAIAIEPHDDFDTTSSIAPILDRLDRSVGVVWDMVNAWSGGEDPTLGAETIGDRVRYVQVKDARWVGGDWQLTPIGDGAVPLVEGLRALAAIGPLPPLSLEWERAWHPDLDPPDVALPRELRALRRIASAALSPSS
jgi:sugar phosphate isomerase/epimerase